jgi:hypothetical protein
MCSIARREGAGERDSVLSVTDGNDICTNVNNCFTALNARLAQRQLAAIPDESHTMPQARFCNTVR